MQHEDTGRFRHPRELGHLLSAITQPFDVCLCLGDAIRLRARPRAVRSLGDDPSTYAIRGNHDHGVAQGIPVTGANGFRYLTQVSRPSMWESLGPEERRYLLQLPVTQRATLGGKRYLMVHATPRDPLDEYLFKDPQIWAKRLQNVEADVVCVGHTHIQFNIDVNGVIVLNPGSVGLPRDGDPRAGYAIIDDNKIEMKRIEYPVEQTIARIEAMPWPRRGKEIMGFVLRSGRLPAHLDQEGSASVVEDEPDPDEA